MKNLTVLCWLCGDTGRVTGDLRSAIRRDLDELREGARLAGDTISVWAALDTGEMMGVTWENLSAGDLWVQLGNSDNMADPANLMAFCDFVMERSPAAQYALIIGGHGSAIKPQTVYARMNLKAKGETDDR